MISTYINELLFIGEHQPRMELSALLDASFSSYSYFFSAYAYTFTYFLEKTVIKKSKL